MQSFHELNIVLDNCCQMPLKRPLKDKQMVLMTDESFRAAGYALFTEDEQKVQSKRKTYAPVAFGPRSIFRRKQICQNAQRNLWRFTLNSQNFGTYFVVTPCL